MKYRYLRIAFSAVCGILCLLLIALWVRSYWRMDDVLDWYGHPIVSADGKLLVDVRYRVVESSPFLLGGYIPVIPVGGVATVPYWLPVILAAAFSLAPWIKWRFSLRTLLIAMTLVAVVLGLTLIALG